MSGSMKSESKKVYHNIPPLWNSESKVLILGSFPSPKSRSQGFFYGHPQNRFWKVLAGVFDEKVPQTIEEKKAFVLSHNIAMWDTIKECEITGASDTSIKNPVPNDLAGIIHESRIKNIFCTGAASYKYYVKLCEKDTGIKAVQLPSTSPANAAWSLERLIEAYRVIKKYV